MRWSNILILFSIILFLYSCSSISEGFSNNKKNSSDEFLVEKKSPLVKPPEFDQLPVPKEDSDQKGNTQRSFKTLVSDTKREVDQNPSNKNLQETLLDKIKSN